MTWRAARSLLVLHQQLKAGAPRARPPATGADEWGLLGDAAHDPTSDHAPHDFPGWGDDVVTAGDFPNRPDLGLDARRVLDDIRRSRDPRVKYGISNGQIFSNHAVTQGGRTYDAWTWRPYSGSDGHYTHGHLSVVGDARADGEQPWATIGGADMDDRQAEQLDNLDKNIYAGLLSLSDKVTGLHNNGQAVTLDNRFAQVIKRLDQNVAALLARPALDAAALAAALGPVLAPVLSEHLQVEVSADALTAALESPRAQAALTSAATAGANAAEDS